MREGEVETCSLRVLVIEYDMDMLDLLEDVIGGIGHEVIRASMDTNAVLQASEQKFDVIIAEVSPSETGPGTLACLRRLQPNALIAVLTSFGVDRTVEEAFKQGADYHIAKPVQMESLRDFISHLARNKMNLQREGLPSRKPSRGG